MPDQPRKWIKEIQSDGEEEVVRVLHLNNGAAELKYIAMSETDADVLITALDWMDSFVTGMVGMPTLPKPRRKSTPKPQPQTLVLELEPPKPKRPKK